MSEVDDVAAKSLAEFVKTNCTHGNYWIRDGMVDVCPKCRRAKEGTAAWGLTHARSCDWRPSEVDATRFVCRPCASEWAMRGSYATAVYVRDACAKIASDEVFAILGRRHEEGRPAAHRDALLVKVVAAKIRSVVI